MPRYLHRPLALGGLALLSALFAPAPPAHAAQSAATGVDENLGPYNVAVLEGGIGLRRPLAADTALIAAGTPWSITGWVNWTRRQPGKAIVAGVGEVDTKRSAWRGVLLLDGELALLMNPAHTLRSGTILQPGRWYAIAATYDGTTARLYVDGKECAAAAAATLKVGPRVVLAPDSADDADRRSR